MLDRRSGGRRVEEMKIAPNFLSELAGNSSAVYAGFKDDVSTAN